jgi:hypothetical protein
MDEAIFEIVGPISASSGHRNWDVDLIDPNYGNTAYDPFVA